MYALLTERVRCLVGLGLRCACWSVVLAAFRSRALLALLIEEKPFGGKAMQQVVMIDAIDNALHQLVQFKNWVACESWVNSFERDTP